MTAVDRLIQRLRIAKAGRQVPDGARVLDVGCSEGELFDHLKDRIAGGVGIDPDRDASVERGPVKLIAGRFPEDLPDEGPFDAVTMLAVLEHIPPDRKAITARKCAEVLRPGGVLVITVPSAAADRVLDLLRTLRLIHGMALEEHHGFDVDETPSIFESHGLELVERRKFQLGFNNLFVFRKPGNQGSTFAGSP